jgi:hypothetical protein
MPIDEIGFLVATFTSEIAAIVRKAALDTVHDALSSRTAPAPAVGRYAFADTTGALPARDVALASQFFAQPNSLRELTDAPQALVDLIDSALRKDKATRSRSSEFLAALRGVRAAHLTTSTSGMRPLQPRPPANLLRSTRRQRRPRPRSGSSARL